MHACHPACGTGRSPAGAGLRWVSLAQRGPGTFEAALREACNPYSFFVFSPVEFLSPCFGLSAVNYLIDQDKPQVHINLNL